MKKLFTLVILLSMGITQIYAQPCINCTNAPTTGDKASTIGYNTTASGLASFAGGNTSKALGSYSFAFGNNAKTEGQYSIALGNNAVANFQDGIAIGNYATSNAANSYVFGMGTSLKPLVNSKPNSIMFGVTHNPSLTILKQPNANVGYLGIGTEDPEEMAHVVGKLLIERTETTASSLQFKYPGSGQAGPFGTAEHYWDIYSDDLGLKFNTVSSNTGVNTQRMIIHGSSVGIGSGITTPLARLHVDNNILAEGDITTLDKFRLAPAANSISGYWELSRTSAGLNFAYMNNALRDVLFMSNRGFIGVGTTNPSAMLDVNGEIKATSADIAGTLSVQTLNAQNLAFAGNTIFNGKVGIFTSNPVAILHLHDSEIVLPRDDTKDSTDIKLRGIHRIFQITTGNSATDGFTIHRDSDFPSVLFFKQHDQQSLSIEGPGGGLGIAPNGNIDIGKNLVVTGSFKAQSATITGALTANALNAQSATINGVLTANSASIPTITGNTTVTGTLSANMLKAPSAKINGLVCAEEVRVQLTGAECWPDFVFGKDYKLLPLKDIEQFIMKNQHLPNVPSSAEVEANGVNLGEMQGTLLQKIEEMTLYIIQLEKRLSELESKKGGE